jgi:hypothetical protein
MGDNQQPLPYIASNDITAFSILDTGTGTVSSYRFDTRSSKSDVIKFDEFRLAKAIDSRKFQNKDAVLLAGVTLIITVLIIAAGLAGILPQNIIKLPFP